MGRIPRLSWKGLDNREEQGYGSTDEVSSDVDAAHD
jgi:hypothetical protein